MFLLASASVVSLYDAFGAVDGSLDDDALFLVARAALGSPGSKTVFTTIVFFHCRSSVQMYYHYHSTHWGQEMHRSMIYKASIMM